MKYELMNPLQEKRNIELENPSYITTFPKMFIVNTIILRLKYRKL